MIAVQGQFIRADSVMELTYWSRFSDVSLGYEHAQIRVDQTWHAPGRRHLDSPRPTFSWKFRFYLSVLIQLWEFQVNVLEQ